MFHTECLRKFFKTQIGNNLIPIHCPQQECKEIDISAQIKDILNNKDYTIYEEQLVNYALIEESKFQCPTPNCNYKAIYGPSDKTFTCVVCDKDYCIFCKGLEHLSYGLSCKDYKEF